MSTEKLELTARDRLIVDRYRPSWTAAGQREERESVLERLDGILSQAGDNAALRASLEEFAAELRDSLPGNQVASAGKQGRPQRTGTTGGKDLQDRVADRLEAITRGYAPEQQPAATGTIPTELRDRARSVLEDMPAAGERTEADETDAALLQAVANGSADEQDRIAAQMVIADRGMGA